MATALRRELAAGGSARLRIRGHSMRPLLTEGAVVELRPLRPAEPLGGAIIAFDSGYQIVVHRVIESRAELIRTRGIASAKPDPMLRRDAVIGVVCRLVLP